MEPKFTSPRTFAGATPKAPMSKPTKSSLEERKTLPAVSLVCHGEELPMTGPNALPDEEFSSRFTADLDRRVAEARRRKAEAEKAK